MFSFLSVLFDVYKSVECFHTLLNIHETDRGNAFKKINISIAKMSLARVGMLGYATVRNLVLEEQKLKKKMKT